MLFDLFRKKQQKVPEINFSRIKTDIHSHLIPGIDDGAQNIEESISLIKRMMDFGFTKLLTTPHIMADYYRNTSDSILKGLDQLRDELSQRNINIEVNAAAEYYLDETFENKLNKGDVLTLGDKFLLFELSFINYPKNLFEVIDKILQKGYTPLLAHPERYPYLAGSVENYERIKDSGCYLQINTLSLAGHYGKQTQKVAEQMVDHYLIDFLGSDLHRMKHADAILKSLSMPYVSRLLTEYQLQNEML
ncbi:tyrosine-protein phosphatase [Paradesertivirga mongoliensis]|uniref:protein-tyrosine-phosphatase n=1 Tax=Paradesertivirga mongoliensis TaxID=2100740 RepID=A0ABW4ZHE8_9SPHI|nr:CpsB/CapC family capsule biosynthesis tyrosine phosphatase [Pedobacter mongoliensis]